MRILVTGGAGFIGSHVVDRYVQLGHEVAVIDNLTTGRRENLNPKAQFLELDITDEAAVRAAFERFRPEVVNHHAAQIDVRRGVADPAYDAGINILGGIRVIQAGLAVGIGKFIYASTGGAVYGNPEYLPCDEQHPVRPISPYGISKHTLEHYLELYALLDGLNYTTLRYANVFGPRQNPEGEAGVNAIFAGMMLRGETPTIFGNGDKTRDYVFVSDVVEANVLALDRAPGETLNIGTGIETTDQEVFDAIAEAVGFSRPAHYAPERKGEVRRIALSCDRAREVLGWAPQISFREGVARTVRHVRAEMASGGL